MLLSRSSGRRSEASNRFKMTSKDHHLSDHIKRNSRTPRVPKDMLIHNRPDLIDNREGVT